MDGPRLSDEQVVRAARGLTDNARRGAPNLLRMEARRRGWPRCPRQSKCAGPFMSGFGDGNTGVVGKRRRPVNDRQLEVLVWIVAGCPSGVMTDSSYKTSAAALAGRGLVVVKRRRGSWSAEATEEGRFFAEHGRYPSTPDAAGTRDRDRRTGSGSPVKQLIAQLVDGSGVVEGMDRARAEMLISSAIRYGKVPAGHYLVNASTGWADGRVELCPLPAWLPAELPSPVVRDRLTKPHPAVAALRDDRLRLQFGPGPRQRALRLLQALVTCAVGREFTATTGDTRTGKALDGLVLVRRGHRVEVRVVQQYDTVPHPPTQKELRDAERHSWVRIPTHDRVPSERLSITLPQYEAYRRHSFRDTASSGLEEQLGEVLREAEMRIVLAERSREQRERAERERRRRWQEVHEAAVVAAREQHRADVLTSQAEQWHRLQAIDAYLDALRQRITDLTGEQAEAALEWLEWAQAHRERVDPLRRDLSMPRDPQFTAEILNPHMKGLSPHGPNGW